MAKPHEPTPPVPHVFIPSSPPVPFGVVADGMDTLLDPKASIASKMKVIFGSSPKKENGGPSGGGPPDVRYEAHKIAMIHYGIEKGIWQEELATDEAFRNRLEAIVKSEKAKAESGHYRDPGGRDR